MMMMRVITIMTIIVLMMLIPVQLVVVVAMVTVTELLGPNRCPSWKAYFAPFLYPCANRGNHQHHHLQDDLPCKRGIFLLWQKTDSGKTKV